MKNNAIILRNKKKDHSNTDFLPFFFFYTQLFSMFLNDNERIMMNTVSIINKLELYDTGMVRYFIMDLLIFFYTVIRGY